MSLAVTPAHLALLANIRRSPLSPRVVVIGAVAVLHHLRLRRDTGDIDLAVVAEETQCIAILTSAGWRRDSHAKQRWRHDESESIVDVLPASARIIQEGHVRLQGDDKELSMVGFDLALSHTTTVSVDDADELTVEVAALPALVMLKIVAWLDRPYERTKDLGDIGQILDQSLDDWDEERWSEPLSTVEHEDQSAFFTGRQLAPLLGPPHRGKVDQFFERIETEAWLAVMSREAGWIGSDPEAIARRRMKAFREGLG